MKIIKPLITVVLGFIFCFMFAQFFPESQTADIFFALIYLSGVIVWCSQGIMDKVENSKEIKK